jgi:hypothetical protein
MHALCGGGSAMKKLACLTVALAAFASTSVALADEPSQPNEPNTPNEPTKTWSTSPTTDETETTATTTTTTTEAAPQTSTTTVTSADPTANAAPLPAPAYDRPSMTVYEKRRPHRAFLITGGAILVGSYGATVVGNAINNGPDQSLYIPVAGPWLHLADREGTQGDVTETLLVGASGVAQGAGALLMLTSVIIPERVPTATITAGSAKIHFAGTGAVGTF